MRSAAGELQRQSPVDRRGRGERAAAELRRSSSRCAATTRRRSSAPLAKLRLEAQQIADEQRRIAGEAARLAKGDGRRRTPMPGGGSPGRRSSSPIASMRCSGRPSSSAGADKPSPPGTAVGQAAAAAKEIARQQIAGRMRETARQMREAAGADGAAGRAAKPAPRAGSG